MASTGTPLEFNSGMTPSSIRNSSSVGTSLMRFRRRLNGLDGSAKPQEHQVALKERAASSGQVTRGPVASSMR